MNDEKDNTSNVFRSRFYSETNMELKTDGKEWETYAIWLEQLTLHNFRKELMEENARLRKACDNAQSILHNAVCER